MANIMPKAMTTSKKSKRKYKEFRLLYFFCCWKEKLWIFTVFTVIVTQCLFGVIFVVSLHFHVSRPLNFSCFHFQELNFHFIFMMWTLKIVNSFPRTLTPCYSFIILNCKHSCLINVFFCMYDIQCIRWWKMSSKKISIFFRCFIFSHRQNINDVHAKQHIKLYICFLLLHIYIRAVAIRQWYLWECFCLMFSVYLLIFLCLDAMIFLKYKKLLQIYSIFLYFVVLFWFQ